MKKNIFGIIIPFSIALMMGLVFYLTFMRNPFGLIFNASFFLMSGALILGLINGAFLSFKSSKRCMKYLGAIPLLLAFVCFVVAISISFDIRMIYFYWIPPKPTKEEWKKDLRFLAEKMNAIYPNLSTKVSQEVFTKTVDDIEARIPSLSDSDIIAELFRLSALPNDAHTIPAVFIPCFNIHDIPIKVHRFEDGWYIIDAASDYHNLVGKKIVKIGALPIEDVAQKFKPLISAENEYAYFERFTYVAFIPEFLKYLGIIDSVKHVDLTLEQNNGKQTVASMKPVRFINKFYWSFVFPVDNRTAPAVVNPRKDFYWFELLNDTQTLYFQFNKVENQKGKESIAKFARRLNDFVNAHEFDRFVIDLRNNMGGNDFYLKYLMDVIRDNKKINQPNKLFVLIGRHTFSSGVLFANKLKLQTKAIFIGEPTSQGPVFGGNPTFVKLPNSKLMFAIATTTTARTQAPWIFQSKNSIAPDINVSYRYEDFLAGKDPVIEKVLTYPVVERKEYMIGETDLHRYTGRFIVSPLIIADISVVDRHLMLVIDDFIEGNLFRVQTTLYPLTNMVFATDISGVSLEFKKGLYGYNSSLTIEWDGQKQEMKRAPDGYTIAMELFSLKKIEEAISLISADKKKYSSVAAYENHLILTGYDLINQNKTQEAIAVFALAVEMYPTSWNAYDSLGEAYLKAKNYELACVNYEKSVQLNPQNKTGKKALKKLKNYN